MAFALTRDTLLCPDNQRELLKMRKPRHAIKEQSRDLLLQIAALFLSWREYVTNLQE